MNLSCGIVGLPNVGKSTLFNALTKKMVPAENYPFCTIDPNIGVVFVRDNRLDQIDSITKSGKIVYATVTFVDIAGLVKGASKGEGLGNKFLTNIKETDAIIQVVRCFEDPNVIHVKGHLDPLDDILTIQLELILSDLQMFDNICNKLEKQLKLKKDTLSLNVFTKVRAHLNEEKPLRLLNLADEEALLVKNYPFLTAKKVLYVANIKEEDLHLTPHPYVERIKEFAKQENSPVIPLCAKLESEIAQLSDSESKEFLETLGLKESGLERLTREAFHLLDLITFFTTGEMETRAWTIKKGMTAPEAAGRIHTDIQKGFIRAEVLSYHDFMHYGGKVAAREAGKVRFEGKDYIVQDGDVILFYHN